jgi:CBS domain-containing protein
MDVREIMTAPVHTLTTEDTLNCAAKLMRDHAVGCLPVVDPENHLVGILTDRDIALGAYEVGEALWRLRVGDHMRSPVVSCHPEDSVASLLRTMRQHQVRRLPVVDQDSRVMGLISLDDVVFASRQPILEPGEGLTADEVDDTYHAVSGRSRHPRTEVHK